MKARDEGAPIVTLYPGVIYGPGVMTEGNLVGRLLADHRAGQLPGIVGAERVWSFAHVEDVALGHVLALESARPGTRYGLGGEDAPQQRAFEIMRDRLGTKLPQRLPYWLADAAGSVEELRARLFGHAPLITRGAVEIFRHDWIVDSQAAGRDLGYPSTPLESGLAAMFEEFEPANSST
jgi:farnesol dehydrogenase